MWKQTVTPNLDPFIYEGGKLLLDWLGWCQAYVVTAFGSGWGGSSAWEAWTKYTQGKHADRNMPAGAYVPIFFDGYWNGVRYGHTAIYKDGVVWTSPYTHKPFADKLSIAEVERIYGMKFAGWSEFSGSKRVVEYVPAATKITKDQLTSLYLEILKRQPDAGAVTHYVGKQTYDFVRNDLLTSNERKTLLANEEAARKAAEVAKQQEAARIEAERLARVEAERIAAEQAAETERLRLEEQALKDAADAKKAAEDKVIADAAEIAEENGYAKENNTLLKQIWEAIQKLLSIFNFGGK